MPGKNWKDYRECRPRRDPGNGVFPAPERLASLLLMTTVRRFASLWLALLGVPAAFCATPSVTPAALPPQPGWGEMSVETNGLGLIRIAVPARTQGPRLPLPTPFPNITAARWIAGQRSIPMAWGFGTAPIALWLEVPGEAPRDLPAVVELETAEGTSQFREGRITLSALDARVQGTHARLETHPGNHRIGFWTDPAESVVWDYAPTRWGTYDVELAYSADGGEGTELELQVAGQTFHVVRPSTGDWYRYQTLPVGRLRLATSDRLSFRVAASSMKGAAALNLKALTLRPAPEGTPVVQEKPAELLLAARDATTHSVLMRYEPATIKNCLGYWANPADWAEWTFEVRSGGAYEIEVLQGCGRGQGGSDVRVEVDGVPASVLTVEETGHFQIFIPRRAGLAQLLPGTHRLALKPVRKQAGAIMDVRQVRLSAVDPSRLPPLRGLASAKRSRWFEFDRYDFEVDGRPVLVVEPANEAPGRPWLWHGEFFGHKPNPDLALLGRGFHIVYMGVPDMLGSPRAVRHWDALHRELTTRYGFSARPALVGLSRGGLYCYNWAIANPTKVACLYGDAPVCDLRSWPGGKGKGPGSAGDWQLAFREYGFASEAEAVAYRGNPVDNLAPLAAARVPLLHVYGDADEVVPWDENTGTVADRYRKLGGEITLIGKPGVKHHPHGLDDSTPIVEFLWRHAAGAGAQERLARHGGGPLDEAGRPLIRKTGTLDLDLVETTPVVVGGRLWRLEWVREQYWDNPRHTNFFRFRDPATGETTPPFAEGHEFGSAFVDGGRVYVSGTLGRSRIDLFSSTDLKAWDSWTALDDRRYGVFNTSVCKAGGEYVLMFEIDRPAEEAGTPFTARFLKSPDLRAWTLTPPECNYARDRYTAPHALRWSGGWFYDFYLEAHDGYETRVVRSRDLVRWEPSPLNPVLKASPADKRIAASGLTDAQRGRVANAVDLNNSDIDFCEFQGRLVINYSWGNQLGVEHLAGGVYDGTLDQFLKGWFPSSP